MCVCVSVCDSQTHQDGIGFNICISLVLAYAHGTEGLKTGGEKKRTHRECVLFTVLASAPAPVPVVSGNRLKKLRKNNAFSLICRTRGEARPRKTSGKSFHCTPAEQCSGVELDA